MKGEWVYMSRQLIKTGTYDHYELRLYVCLDVALYSLDQINRPYAFAIYPYQDAGAPPVNFNITGQRLATTSVGMWGAERYADALHGFVQVATGCTIDEPWEEVWENHFTLTIEVNDPTMGTTDPVPASYTEKAREHVPINALPNVGYHLDHWERDSVPCGNITPYTIYMLKDYMVKCVFAPD